MARPIVTIGDGRTVDTDILKGEDLSKYLIKIDEASSTVTYYGWAEPGSATSSSVWRILKKTVSGNVTTYSWAGGDTSFDNVWDNRTGLSYS